MIASSASPADGQRRKAASIRSNSAPAPSNLVERRLADNDRVAGRNARQPVRDAREPERERAAREDGPQSVPQFRKRREHRRRRRRTNRARRAETARRRRTRAMSRRAAPGLRSRRTAKTMAGATTKCSISMRAARGGGRREQRRDAIAEQRLRRRLGERAAGERQAGEAQRKREGEGDHRPGRTPRAANAPTARKSAPFTSTWFAA